MIQGQSRIRALPALAAIFLVLPASAQTVKIGLVTSYSGFLAQAGDSMDKGLSLYAKLQLQVDSSIGGVLQALASKPAVAENTVVIATSDHGEYGASHGLRGKGASAYEEGIRVPLIVFDPRGELASAPGKGPSPFASSAEVA